MKFTKHLQMYYNVNEICKDTSGERIWLLAIGYYKKKSCSMKIKPQISFSLNVLSKVVKTLTL